MATKKATATTNNATANNTTNNATKKDKYSYFSDEAIIEEVEMNMACYNEETKSYDRIDEIEYLNHNAPELLHEWFYRIVTHYNLHTYIREDVLMQYLYYDWIEAIMHFYRYGSLVGELLQQYIDEITEDLQDDWETRQIPN